MYDGKSGLEDYPMKGLPLTDLAFDGEAWVLDRLGPLLESTYGTFQVRRRAGRMISIAIALHPKRHNL